MNGLATSGIISDICVVFHCASKGRTILAQLPSAWYHPSVFIPMIVWITGDESNPIPSERMTAWKGGKYRGTGPCSVRTVVFRGGDLARHIANPDRPDNWMPNFKVQLSRAVASSPVKLDILAAPRSFEGGAVLVDKESGDITYLMPETGLRIAGIRIADPCLPSNLTYSRARELQYIFNAILKYSRRGIYASLM